MGSTFYDLLIHVVTTITIIGIVVAVCNTEPIKNWLKRARIFMLASGNEADYKLAKNFISKQPCCDMQRSGNKAIACAALAHAKETEEKAKVYLNGKPIEYYEAMLDQIRDSISQDIVYMKYTEDDNGGEEVERLSPQNNK